MVANLTCKVSSRTAGTHFSKFRELKFLIIPLVVCFVMTANLSEDLSSMFDLKFENVPYEANLEMLTVFGLMVGSTYMLERLCRFGQYKEFVGWF